LAQRATTLSATITHARRLNSDLAAAQIALTDAQLALQQLETERSTTIDLPMQQLTGTLNSAAAVLANAPSDLKVGTQTRAPDNPADRVAWAEQLAREVAIINSSAADANLHAASLHQTAAGRETEMLTLADVERYEELAPRIRDAAAEKTLAERDRAEAERQIPIRDDLSHRIGQLRPLYDALETIRKAMSPGAFPAAAIEIRQERFLQMATSHLEDMTGGRFGFGHDFTIVDGITSQSRDTKTLSGGETFQASLALALAVVDMAGLAGGRVETFILDEGFGTLDQEALSAALEVLAAQTIGGRLVGVISHMADVVEEIDDVLLVSATNAGSVAGWLTSEQRRKFADGGYPDLLS